MFGQIWTFGVDIIPEGKQNEKEASFYVSKLQWMLLETFNCSDLEGKILNGNLCTFLFIKFKKGGKRVERDYICVGFGLQRSNVEK